MRSTRIENENAVARANSIQIVWRAFWRRWSIIYQKRARKFDYLNYPRTSIIRGFRPKIMYAQVPRIIEG